MISIKNVNKYYNKGKRNQIHVINNTSIDLPDKGLVAMLGASGCGKTTLLNAIGGLDKVNNGKIYINDKLITSKISYKVDKIRNLSIGYIFQDYKLIDDMSVYDNIAMALRMIGIKDKNEIKTRVEYILDRVGMLRYRYRPCGMLSGGERQRVGIARAIVKNPDIILADEPTGNLDSKNTIEVMNIIKAISRDKLVILVTHEEDIARFYADRILEIKDGEIVKDYNNKVEGKIDYKIDNTLYLKDFKYHKKNNDSGINIDYYSDKEDKLNLVIVLKNGNIYIKNKDKERIEVIDDNSSVEVVNDHYKKLDKSVYEKYSFDYEKIINKDIKLKYSSIFNIGSIITHGFKKVFGYSFIKKLLLGGFFLSALFTTYSVSNIMGLLTVNDDSFIRTNKNYLKIERNKIKVDDYLDYEGYDGIEYMIPGDSQVGLSISNREYYQTKNSRMNIYGSISSTEMIDENDIILGRMPEEDNEIVIDKMVYDKVEGIEMIGYYKIDKIIDVIVSTNKDYKIVGVVDKGSPSIYASRSEILSIIINGKKNDEYDDMWGQTISTVDVDSEYNDDNKILNYNEYSDKIKITKGRIPENDYEVIINKNLEEEYKLNKEIDKKVNDHKLLVVGYYTSMDDINSYFVNSNTVKYNLITNSKGMMIYSKDKDKVINEFRDKGIKVLDVYKVDKENYINSVKERVNSSLIVASIMLGISLIEIILMVRSSFMSRIKEIGIYRAIGVKKIDIYKMFTSESFAITTLASVPGVILMSYSLSVLSGISYIRSNYVMNIYVMIFCIILMYIFNIIIGLIPVFNTIRKSPARILSGKEID